VFLYKEYDFVARATKFYYHVSCCDLGYGFSNGHYRQINRWGLLHSEDAMKTLQIDPVHTTMPGKWEVGHGANAGPFGVNSDINIYCDGQPRLITVSFKGHVDACDGTYFSKANNGWNTNCDAKVPCIHPAEECPELDEPVDNNEYYCNVDDEFREPCEAYNEPSCNYMGCCWKPTYGGSSCFCPNPTTTTSTPMAYCDYNHTGDGHIDVIDSDAYYCTHIHDLDRSDCGWANMEPWQCEMRGCCWSAPRNGYSTAWCFCPGPTTTSSTPAPVCSKHIFPADSDSFYCAGVTQRYNCYASNQYECEHEKGCCWDGNSYGVKCFCPLGPYSQLPPNPANDYAGQCAHEAWAYVRWRVAEFWLPGKPVVSCADYATLTSTARDIARKFGDKFSEIAELYPIVPTVDAAQGCTWALHEMYRDLAQSWQFWGGSCPETIGDISLAWQEGATAFEPVFSAYGSDGSGAGASVTWHFAEAFRAATLAFRPPASSVSCTDVPLWASSVEKMMDSVVAGGRKWAGHAKKFSGLSGVKTGMSVQWSDTMKICADTYESVVSGWATSCAGNLAGATVASDLAASLLGKYSEGMAGLQEDWSEAFYVADGGGCLGACFPEADWALENWKRVDYFRKFGYAGSNFSHLFLNNFPGQGLSCSKNWASTYDKYATNVKKCSSSWSKLFKTSSATLADKSYQAGSCADKWAGIGMELSNSLALLVDWSRVAVTENSETWSNTMQSMVSKVQEAAADWSGVFAGTKSEVGLKMAGTKWAEALDSYGAPIQSYSQAHAGYQATLLGQINYGPVDQTIEWISASKVWAKTWNHFGRTCRQAACGYAPKFNSMGAQIGWERDETINNARAVSDKFRAAFSNNAMRLRDSGVSYHTQSMRVTWEASALELDESCGGKEASLAPETAAWAFKKVLKPDLSPAQWDDNENNNGWANTLNTVAGYISDLHNNYNN